MLGSRSPMVCVAGATVLLICFFIRGARQDPRIGRHLFSNPTTHSQTKRDICTFLAAVTHVVL